MTITERQVGDVTILDLKGKITLDLGSDEFEATTRGLADGGQKQFIVNFADCPYIDSAALAALVRNFTYVSRRGGKLKLMNLPKRIVDLLMITKLLTTFEIFEDEQTALASFAD